MDAVTREKAQLKLRQMDFEASSPACLALDLDLPISRYLDISISISLSRYLNLSRPSCSLARPSLSHYNSFSFPPSLFLPLPLFPSLPLFPHSYTFVHVHFHANATLGGAQVGYPSRWPVRPPLELLPDQFFINAVNLDVMSAARGAPGGPSSRQLIMSVH